MKRFLQRCFDYFLSGYVENIVRDYLLRRPVLHGLPEYLEVASTAQVSNALFNTSSGRIKIADRVFFGHNVCVLAGSHDYTKFGEERMNAILPSDMDIHIEEGAWLATNVTVVGPVVIGRHAVVAAGSLVLHNVAPFTVVAGVPARVIKHLTSFAGDKPSNG